MYLSKLLSVFVQIAKCICVKYLVFFQNQGHSTIQASIRCLLSGTNTSPMLHNVQTSPQLLMCAANNSQSYSMYIIFNEQCILSGIITSRNVLSATTEFGIQTKLELIQNATVQSHIISTAERCSQQTSLQRSIPIQSYRFERSKPLYYDLKQTKVDKVRARYSQVQPGTKKWPRKRSKKSGSLMPFLIYIFIGSVSLLKSLQSFSFYRNESLY